MLRFPDRENRSLTVAARSESDLPMRKMVKNEKCGAATQSVTGRRGKRNPPPACQADDSR